MAKIKPKLSKKPKSQKSDWEILPIAKGGDLIKLNLNDYRPSFVSESTGVKRQNIQKPVPQKKQEQTIKQSERQSIPSKAAEVLLHPLTAISNYSQKGYIPDNFSKGEVNPIDYAIDVINPAFYINAAGRTLENIITPETYTDIPKAVGSALVNLAGEEPPAEWDEAGLKTLGKAGEAIAGLSAFGLGFNQLAKRSPFVREQIYKAIEPVGYGAKEKIMKSPKAWIRNTFFVSPEERAVRIGSEFLPPSSKSAEEIIKVGKNRLDSFRLGLNLPQNFDTFEKIGEDLYRIKNMNPEVGEFSSIYNDLLANEIKNNINYGDDALKNLTKRHDKLTSPVIKTDFGDYSLNDLRRYLKKEGDDFAPWEQHRIVEKAKNKDFTHSVYDADRQGIMGSFRWDIDKPNYGGDIHFQSNDTWNLNPWEKRGPISIKDNSSFLHKYYFKPLQNVEALSLLGGKPFNIRNNFIVDPKTFKIKESFKQGGSISDWEIIPEAQSGRVIEDNMGQWKYPGEITKINSPNITMQGVNYPVLGVSDTNDVQMMYPNQDYKFKGSSVTEYPVMQPGGKTTRPPLEISDPREYAKRAQAYQDSLKLYTSYQDLIKKLNENNYVPIANDPFSQLTEDQVIQEANRNKQNDSFIDNFIGKFYERRPYIKASKEGNLYKTLDFYPGTINEDLGFQYFSDKIKPKSKKSFRKHRYAGDARLVYNYENVKPVEPVIYKPEKNQESQKPKLETRNVLTPEFETVRRKKDKIELLEPKTAQLQSSPINQELNLIPFAKGTYYRRPRQSQEIGQNIGQFPGRVTGLTDLKQKGSGRRMGTIDNEGHIVDIVEGFAEGGELPEAGSGYKVIRSSERKGKTHKVIGPDGTVKFFGDSKLGQHPKDPARKKAFYARHKKNLAKNPYFRAFARKTWEEGGELDFAQEGLSLSDKIQLGLDAAQFVPNPYIAGAAYLGSLPFTTYDVMQDLYQGDYKQAGLDALGYIPAFKAFKYGVKGEKLLDTTSKLAKQLAKANMAINTGNLAVDAKKKKEGGILPDLMEMAAGGQFLTVGGEYHRIYKNADGDIMVNHPKEDKGKWDTINLTDKAGAKTVADGVAATKKWHKENPYAFGGRLPKAQIGLLSKLKENLGNLDTGEGYKTSLDKVLKTAIGLEGKDYSKDRMSPIAREQDALRLYLGTPTKTGAFEKTGENTYRIKDYNRLYPDTLLSDEDVSYWGTPDEEGIKYPADEAFNLYPYSDFVMGRHYITKGKDDKGKYLQYRDFWNLDPTRHANEWIDKNVNPKLAKYLKKATPVLDKLESAVFNPFELTDKVYYDPVTKLRSDIKTRNENPKYANVPTPNNFAFGGLPKADNGKNIKDKKALSEVQQKINEGYAAKKKYQEDIIKYAKSVENDPDFKKKVKDFLQEKCGGGLACISSASKLLEGAGYPLGKGYFSNPTLQEDILSKKLPGYAFDNNLKNIEVGDIMQVTGKSLKTGKERAPHHAMVITKADKDIAGNLPNLQYFGSQGDIASIGFHPLHANNYNDPSEFQIIKKQFVDPSLIQKRDSLQKVLREEDPSYGKPSNWKPRYLDYKPNERFAYDEKNYDINNPFVSLTKSRIESMYEPLLKNKEELMKKYNLTNTEFNELTKRLGGIGEQESENAGFTSGRYNIKRLPIVGPLSQFLGKISQGEFSNAFDSGEYSVGPWQTKRNYVPKNNYKRGSVEEAFETLADRYKNQVPSKYRGTDYGYGLAVNKYKGLQNPQNEYLKKVLEYSKKFDVDRDKNAGYEEYKESKKQLNPVISERKAFRDELVPTPNNFAFGGNLILEKYGKGGKKRKKFKEQVNVENPEIGIYETPTADIYGTPIEAEIINKPDLKRSYYDSRTDTIYTGKDFNEMDQYDKDQLLAHENYHSYQYKNDRSTYLPVKDVPFKKPPMVATDDIYYGYHNRKPIETQTDINRFKQDNPSFKFIPDNLVYDYIVDPEQYMNPYTLEGEAKFYEDLGAFSNEPLYAKGGLVKKGKKKTNWEIVPDTEWEII